MRYVEIQIKSSKDKIKNLKTWTFITKHSLPKPSKVKTYINQKETFKKLIPVPYLNVFFYIP